MRCAHLSIRANTIFGHKFMHRILVQPIYSKVSSTDSFAACAELTSIVDNNYRDYTLLSLHDPICMGRRSNLYIKYVDSTSRIRHKSATSHTKHDPNWRLHNLCNVPIAIQTNTRSHTTSNEVEIKCVKRACSPHRSIIPYYCICWKRSKTLGEHKNTERLQSSVFSFSSLALAFSVHSVSLRYVVVSSFACSTMSSRLVLSHTAPHFSFGCVLWSQLWLPYNAPLYVVYNR